ncbi:MAG: DUF535 family protein [Chitinophagaceae bacterium]
MFSAATRGWELAKKAYSNEAKSYRCNQQYKCLWHVLINPHFASRWFKKLYSPEYILITQHRPRIFIKPFRVYMSVRWNKRQKVKVILDTYQFIRSKGEGFLQAIICEKYFRLADFQLKDGSTASIVLEYDERYRKEGELGINLVCEKLGGVIAGGSFSFENKENENWVCRIGCIQGHRNTEVNIAKTAQNLMYGLRPKALMVFVIQEFTKHLGIRSVYGAGQSIQAYRRKHAINIPWFHKISFDYNKLWLEHGGEPEKDGWFLLPSSPLRKDISEIKANKRAGYKRRYEMMDHISTDILCTLQQIVVPG